MKGYKAFNADMTCKGFRYKVGCTYTHDGPIGVCHSGFHFCRKPFDVLNYYQIHDSVFCEIEAVGEVKEGDDKCVTDKIKILRELTLNEFITLSIDSLFSGSVVTDDEAKIGSSGDWAKIGSSGGRAQIGSSGDWAQIGSSGDRAQIGSSGDWAKIGSSGYGDVICGIGCDSIAKGSIGSWLVLAEYINGTVDDVKAVFIDGDEIQGGVYYKLSGGELVEVDL